MEVQAAVLCDSAADYRGKLCILGTFDTILASKLPENVFFYSQNLIFNLQQIKFERPGQYSIDVLLDGDIVARVPLQVVQAQQKE